MTRKARKLQCTPDDVFGVLANGWLYPSWVVGATRMRNVEAAWPQKGARLHHSVGTWPFIINDSTSSLEWEPPHRMVLQARGWPMGEARVEIHVSETSDGCLVMMEEYPDRGPASFLPGLIFDLPLRLRNRETLNRLAFLAEGMAKERLREERERAEEHGPTEPPAPERA